MKLLFLDFETQGDDPKTTNVTEIGALLLQLPPTGLHPDTEIAKHWATIGHEEIARLSQLVYHADYPPQTEEIIDITGITDEMLKAEGIPSAQAFPMLEKLMDQADYILAHNAAFDRGVLEENFRRLGLDLAGSSSKWICTIQDVPYSKKYKCKKLSHLAYDHGYTVDVKTLHRAINDVELLAKFLLGSYSIKDIIAYRNTPWVCVFLNGVKGPWIDGGVTNNQAKKLGFSWEKPWGTDLSFSKRWVKRIKEDQLQAEKGKTPPHFTLTRQVDPAVTDNTDSI